MVRIPQVKELVLLGVTFQSDTRFNIHVRKEQTQNKFLYVLRTLIRREGLAVYGAAEVY